MLDFIPEKKEKPIRIHSPTQQILTERLLFDVILYCTSQLGDKNKKDTASALGSHWTPETTKGGKDTDKSLCSLPRGTIIESFTEEVIFQQERISGFQRRNGDDFRLFSH